MTQRRFRTATRVCGAEGAGTAPRFLPKYTAAPRDRPTRTQAAERFMIPFSPYAPPCSPASPLGRPRLHLVADGLLRPRDYLRGAALRLDLLLGRLREVVRLDGQLLG